MDEELFRQFQNGNEEGLRVLLERYGDRLSLYLAGFTKDLNDAEDLMLEAFARVCRAAPVFGDGGFKAYLYKTGRNLAIRHCSRLLSRQAFHLEDLTTEPESGEILEHAVVSREQEEILHLCMGRLEPDVREALWLVYFENLSYEDSAQVLRVKRKHLDYLLQKGKKLLKAELEKEGICDARV